MREKINEIEIDECQLYLNKAVNKNRFLKIQQSQILLP